jgi:hypothetical protein
VELIEGESKMVITGNWGLGVMERCWSKFTKFQLDKKISSGDLLYSIMIIGNNN